MAFTLEHFIHKQSDKKKVLLEPQTEAVDDGEKFTRHMDPPNIVMLRRKAIRVFPGGKKVALYYADKIDKYVTVPYDDYNYKTGGKTKPSGDILQVNEEEFKKLEESSNQELITEAVKKAAKKKVKKVTIKKKVKKEEKYGVEKEPNLHQKGKMILEKDSEHPLDTMKKIVGGAQALPVKFKDGTSMKVDTLTASAVLNVHKALNDINKAKLHKLMHKDKNNFMRVAAFAHGHMVAKPKG